MRWAVALLLCAVWTGFSASAEMPAGADDPKYIDAVSRWLDSSQDHLPLIDEVAKNGNEAAQILAMRITDTRFVLPGSDRGLSQEAWYSGVGFTSGLGRAFAAARQTPKDDAARNTVAMQLFAVGEPIAGLMYMTSEPAAFWDRNLCDAALTSEVSLTTRLIAILTLADGCPGEWLSDVQISAFCIEARETLDQEPYTRIVCDRLEQDDLDKVLNALLSGESAADIGVVVDALSEWIERGGAQRYVRTCQASCPDDTSECAARLFSRSGGLIGQITLPTPSQTLIPDAKFSVSPLVAWQVWQAAQPGFGIENKSALVHWFGGDDVGPCLASAYDETLSSWLLER